MKKLFLTFLFGVIALAGCSLFVDAGAYNDKIVAIHDKVNAAYDAYVDASSNTPLEGDLDALDKKRQEAADKIKEYKKELEAVGDLGDDSRLKDAFMADFDQALNLLENEEKELVALWKKMAASEEVSDEDTKKEDELFDTIQKKNDESYQKLSAVQETFAAEHGYELEATRK